MGRVVKIIRKMCLCGFWPPGVGSLDCTGHGVGFGETAPAVNRWGVIFQSLSRPERGEYRGYISASDPSRVDEAELAEILEEQLVLAAINRSRYVWRPAEAIANETSLAVERVRTILENSTNVIPRQSEPPRPLVVYNAGPCLQDSRRCHEAVLQG